VGRGVAARSVVGVVAAVGTGVAPVVGSVVTNCGATIWAAARALCSS